MIKALKFSSLIIFLNTIILLNAYSQDLFHHNNELLKRLKCVAQKKDGTMCLEKPLSESIYCSEHYIQKNSKFHIQSTYNQKDLTSSENALQNSTLKKSKTTLLNSLVSKRHNKDLQTLNLSEKKVNSTEIYEMSDDETYTPKYNLYNSEGELIEESSSDDYTGIIICALVILLIVAIIIYLKKPTFSEHTDFKEDNNTNNISNFKFWDSWWGIFLIVVLIIVVSSSIGIFFDE